MKHQTKIEFLEPGSGMVCRHCGWSFTYMLAVQVNNHRRFYCRSCFSGIALIATTYLEPSPFAHYAHDREPQIWNAPTPIQVQNHCLKLIKQGRKIQAIKDFRTLFGTGLKEAKDQIDYWQTGADGWVSVIMHGSIENAFVHYKKRIQTAWREIQARGYDWPSF